MKQNNNNNNDEHPAFPAPSHEEIREGREGRVMRKFEYGFYNSNPQGMTIMDCFLCGKDDKLCMLCCVVFSVGGGVFFV